MSAVPAWRLCYEIGLNHLGQIQNAFDIVNLLYRNKIPCAVSVQVREEEFYSKNMEHLKLSEDDYLDLRKMCLDFQIPFGLALGPLKKLNWILDSGLSPDFLKLLGIATNDRNFLDGLDNFHCEKYFLLVFPVCSSLNKRLFRVCRKMML